MQYVREPEHRSNLPPLLRFCEIKQFSAVGIKAAAQQALLQDMLQAPSGRPHVNKFRSQLTLSSLPCSYPATHVTIEAGRQKSRVHLGLTDLGQHLPLDYGSDPLQNPAVKFAPRRLSSRILTLPVTQPARCTHPPSEIIEDCRLQTLSFTSRATPELLPAACPTRRYADRVRVSSTSGLWLIPLESTTASILNAHA